MDRRSRPRRRRVVLVLRRDVVVCVDVDGRFHHLERGRRVDGTKVRIFAGGVLDSARRQRDQRRFCRGLGSDSAGSSLRIRVQCRMAPAACECSFVGSTARRTPVVSRPCGQAGRVSVATSCPNLAAAFDGTRVRVYVRGGDDALYGGSIAGVSVSGFSWVGLGGVLTAWPAAASGGGVVRIFVRGGDGQLLHADRRADRAPRGPRVSATSSLRIRSRCRTGRASSCWCAVATPACGSVVPVRRGAAGASRSTDTSLSGVGASASP